MKRRALALTVLGLQVATWVVGCSAEKTEDQASHPSLHPQEEKTMNLDETKSLLLQMTIDAQAAFEGEADVRLRRSDEGTILGCHEGGVKWSGAADITFSVSGDVRERMRSIADVFEPRADFTTESDRLSSAVEDSLVVHGPGGALLAIDPSADGEVFHLSTFSACVTDLGTYDGSPVW